MTILFFRFLTRLFFTLLPNTRADSLLPTGFNWGCGGAGPGQLALAILAHAADDAAALAEWERFREEFIKNLYMCQPFRFTGNDVTAFLNGVPVDAQGFIRPVRKKPGFRTFWKRLIGSTA